MSDSKKPSTNSGYYNSGHYNSGTRNSGYYNSGHYNSGHYNSGYYNSGHYNSGFFNTNEPTVRMFNKDTGKKRSEIVMPCIYLPMTEWVADSKMTDVEKAANPKFSAVGGYLRRRTYKEAWAVAWAALDQQVRQQFLDLPGFDADIFLEITGIDVRAVQASCDGKVVEIDGKKYRLTEV